MSNSVKVFLISSLCCLLYVVLTFCHLYVYLAASQVSLGGQ